MHFCNCKTLFKSIKPARMKPTLLFLCSTFLSLYGYAQQPASTPFGDTLRTLITLSESGDGFGSIALEAKISAAGYTNATQVRVVLPGAKACLLSTYDQSYVAWFGAYPTLTAAKTRVNTLTTQIRAALGDDFKSGDDYADPKKGTFMRFFYYETNQNRSSAVVSLELAFFQNQYQVRLSVPAKAPETYLRTKYYDVDPTAEHQTFKTVYKQLQDGIINDFASLRGELLSDDVISGKTYALKSTLPGMRCVASLGAARLNKEYCNCLSEAVYPSYTDTHQPFYLYMEYLIYVFQPQEYVISVGRGSTDEDIETVDIAPARPSKITSEKVASLYIQQKSDGYRIGIQIRDISGL